MTRQANRAGANIQLLHGNLGKDAEFHTAENGVVYCVFSLCVNGFINNTSKPNWFRVKAFNSLAEAFRKYGKKGRKIFITGHTENERYEKDTTVTLSDGTEVTGKAPAYMSTVIMDAFEYTDSKPIDSDNISNC